MDAAAARRILAAMAAIWNQGDELTLVNGLAGIWWLDLCSPFGDSPAGIDWSIELPPGLTVLDTADRPRFGVGPDAHRPHVERDGQRLSLDFPGYLPARNHRRPMTHHRSWCDLHHPLVVVADDRADGSELVIHRRAMGDHHTSRYAVTVLDDPGVQGPSQQRRNVQPVFLPWFSEHEQAAVAHALLRCGITDVNLNWHTFGVPLLPSVVYARSVRILRREIPGVRVWIGGMPGADSVLPRAEGVYGRPIPFVADPAVAVEHGRDLVIESERSWCEATGADGVMITLAEPALDDEDPWPPHSFSAANRRAFAREAGLGAVPDPIAIRMHHPEGWIEFCCRQLRRLVEVARRGHGERPLAVCQVGRHAPAANAAPPEWRRIAESADLSIFIHHHEDAAAPLSGERWGLSRLGGMPQAWWEHWNDRLGCIPDPGYAVPDMKMQLALSGGTGVRVWNWAHFDGRVQRHLIEWR